MSLIKAANIPSIGDKVFPWRLDNSTKEEGDTINVYTPDEDNDIHSAGTTQYRRVCEVLVEIRAPGGRSEDVLFDYLDSVCAAVEVIILSDRFLGTFGNSGNGLKVNDVRQGSTSIGSDDEGESYIASAKLTFSVEYFTSEGDTESMHEKLKSIYSTICIDGNESAKDNIEVQS